jgi:hypothetical protein
MNTLNALAQHTILPHTMVTDEDRCSKSSCTLPIDPAQGNVSFNLFLR